MMDYMTTPNDTQKAMRAARIQFEGGSLELPRAGLTTRRHFRKFLEKHYRLSKRDAMKVADKMGFSEGGKK